MIHPVLGSKITPPFDESYQSILLGMGCFWGAERLFWKQSGVKVTAVGYAGGERKNPTYQQVCSGATGHAEVVLVVFEPKEISLQDILQVFWENHDPTQLNRQGNDIGSQYRSCLYLHSEEDLEFAKQSLKTYQDDLAKIMSETIKTELSIDQEFFYAEEYHQQYLHKNPNGYCGLKGTGVRFSDG